MVNRKSWLSHVSKTMRANPGGDFKKMLREANKTFKNQNKNKNKNKKRGKRRKNSRQTRRRKGSRRRRHRK